MSDTIFAIDSEKVLGSLFVVHNKVESVFVLSVLYDEAATIFVSSECFVVKKSC